MGKNSLAPLGHTSQPNLLNIIRSTGLSDFMQIDFARAKRSIAFEQVKEGTVEIYDGGIKFRELRCHVPNEELARILCLKKQDFKFHATDEIAAVAAEILNEVLNTKHLPNDGSRISLTIVKDVNVRKRVVNVLELIFMKTKPSTVAWKEFHIILTIREKPEQILGWWKYSLRRARARVHNKRAVQLVENANIVLAYIMANCRREIDTDALIDRAVVTSAQRTIRVSEEVRGRVNQIVPEWVGTIPTESEDESEEIGERNATDDELEEMGEMNESDEIDYPAEGAAELKEEWIMELARELEPGHEHPMRQFIIERKCALAHTYDFYKREVAKSQSLEIELGIVSKKWSEIDVDELKIQNEQLADKNKTLEDKVAQLDQREKASAALVQQKHSELVAELQNDLAAEQRKVQDTNEELAQQKKWSEIDVDELKIQNEQLADKNKTLEDKLAQLDQMEKASAALVQQKHSELVAKLQNDLAAEQRKVQDTNEELAQQKKAFLTVQSQLEKAQEQLKVLTRERLEAVVKKETKADEFQQQLSNLARRMEDIRMQNATAVCALQSQLQNADQQLKVVTQERNAAVMEKDNKVAEIQQEMSTMSRRLEEILWKGAQSHEEHKKSNEQLARLIEWTDHNKLVGSEETRRHLSTNSSTKRRLADYNKLVGSVETRRHLFTNSTTKRREETWPQVSTQAEKKYTVATEVTDGSHTRKS